MGKKKTVTGVHLGADTVRLVQIIRRKQQPLKASCAALTPVQGYFDAAERVRNTVQAISTCKSSVGRKIDKSQFTVSCLSWPEIMVTAFELPEANQEDLEQTLIYEIEQVSPFEISSSVIDYEIVEDETGQMVLNNGTFSVIVAISPQTTVQEHYSIIKKAGLKHNLVDADCAALLNCFDAMSEDEDAALLNIDMSHTIVAIPSGQGAPFIRNIDYGGKNVINSVVRAKGIRKEDFAGTLRGDSANLSTDLLNVLDKSCSGLSKNISRTLQYWIAENPQRNIKQVFLTGELSLMPIIVDILNEQIELPVKVWNPFKNIEIENITGRDLLEKTGSAFAIAAGLAVREPEYV